MKNVALEAELDVEGKNLTSHSGSKTLVKKLKAFFLILRHLAIIQYKFTDLAGKPKEPIKSAKKCYHRCNRPHKLAFTGRLPGR